MTDDGDGRGKYQTGIDDEEYVEALRRLGASSTPEVADEVGAADRTALYRLKKLEESGTVESKKIGTARVWTLVDE